MNVKLNPTVAAKIRAMEAEALALGWTFQELWESRFWHMEELAVKRGLASFLKPDWEIGEITAGFIEIYHVDHHGRRAVQKWRKIGDGNKCCQT